jgi:hypothetical protein
MLIFLFLDIHKSNFQKWVWTKVVCICVCVHGKGTQDSFVYIVLSPKIS